MDNANFTQQCVTTMSESKETLTASGAPRPSASSVTIFDGRSPGSRINDGSQTFPKQALQWSGVKASVRHVSPLTVAGAATAFHCVPFSSSFEEPSVSKGHNQNSQTVKRVCYNISITFLGFVKQHYGYQTVSGALIAVGHQRFPHGVYITKVFCGF